MTKRIDDEYSRIFYAEECEVIKFALLECYKYLKIYEDEWHQRQCEKIKDLLARRFEMKLE